MRHSSKQRVIWRNIDIDLCSWNENIDTAVAILSDCCATVAWAEWNWKSGWRRTFALVENGYVKSFWESEVAVAVSGREWSREELHTELIQEVSYLQGWCGMILGPVLTPHWLHMYCCLAEIASQKTIQMWIQISYDENNTHQNTNVTRFFWVLPCFVLLKRCKIKLYSNKGQMLQKKELNKFKW